MIPDLIIAEGADAVTVSFRPLNGRIEADVRAQAGGAEAPALWLAKALVTGIADKGGSRAFEDLTISAFDAVLAHLQMSLFGSRLQCQARCGACGDRFEFTLSLPEMQRAIRQEAEGHGAVEGIVTDPGSGRCFRLPCIRDLAILRGQGAEAWLRALLVSGSFDPAMEAEVARAVPLLSQDIAATCPECAADAPVRFDIAAYLVASIEADAAFLWREVHLLARGYGWSPGDIFDLPRADRRRLTTLVLADTGSIRRAS